MKTKLFFASLLLGVASCAPSKLLVKKTNSKEYNVEVNQTGVVMRPLLADLDVVTERKSVTYKAPINLSMSDIKNNAMQLFLETHKCDYVVDPIFTTSTTVENKKLTLIEVKLTGLSATYKKIYQVDSLPKSVSQDANLSKKQTRLDYYNSIDEIQNRIGLDLVMGNYNGLQIDYPLAFDPTYRLYLAADLPGDNPTSFKADVLTDLDTTNNQSFPSTTSQTNFSVGIFKEFTASPKTLFRLQGGLNYSSFMLEENAKASAFYSVTTLGSVGLRLGTALDYRLFKNIHLVGKFHTNLGVYNHALTTQDLTDPTNKATIKLNNISFSGLQSSYLGLGLRFLF